MRIWILSDLHLEYADLRHPLKVPEADVCVIAGDLCRGPANGVRWLANNVAHAMTCVYVAGNHEYYKGAIREGLATGREAAKTFPNIHFLENDLVTIDGFRFVGATLWTDYRVEGNPLLAMSHARERMNDHRQIAKQRKPWQRFLPETAYRMHQESRQFIERSLQEDAVQTVVVTHHLPHPRSLPGRSAGDLTNAAYASDLSALIMRGTPTLWVHGHSHESSDYWVEGTRIVSNPRGYDDENVRFEPQLVVTI